MADFICSAGHINCPKCFGWQVRDLTKRNNKGWPLEPANIVDCDYCLGKGEVPGIAPANTGSGWIPSPLVKLPTFIFEPTKPKRGRPPKVDATPMPINDIGDWQNKPVDIPKPTATGWAVFNEEPGNG